MKSNRILFPARYKIKEIIVSEFPIRKYNIFFLSFVSLENIQNINKIRSTK